MAQSGPLRHVESRLEIKSERRAPLDTSLQLLCLDCNSINLTQSKQGCPHPSKCDLYYVNKDTLFSFHAASEQFLQKMMALYVSSHYKNTPNDLLLMSDNPSHHLFALLGPVPEGGTSLPEILCVIQVIYPQIDQDIFL